ncbi:MAG: hypothetical protein HOV80_37460 [Polyangiaceae bacterium]|nr:hypothetical protein [Polyangiaceae bacterium]
MTNERIAVSGADSSELDMAAVDQLLARRALSLVAEIGRDEAATRLGILSKAATRYAPTYVGLYVFGKIPQLHFPEWGVGCAAFAGTAITDRLDARADLEGPAGSLVEGAIEFVRGRSGGTLSAEAEYEEGTLREAVVNAIVHRDLRRPSRVALRVFVDRLEIWSPGGPPDGLGDLEELGRDGGVSQPRNPLLASLARHLGYGEQIGRGLATMIHASQRAHERRIEIRVSPKEVLVTIPSRWQRPQAALS